MDRTETQFSFPDILFVLSKHKWSACVLLAAGLLASATWVFFVREELYAAQAKILVKLGQEQAPPATVVGGTPQVIGYRQQEVNSEVEILKNATLLAQLVDEMELDKPAPEPPRPADTIPLIRYEVKRFIKGINQWIDGTLIRMGLREAVPLRDRAIQTLSAGLKVVAEKESNIFSAELALPQKRSAAFVLNRLIDAYLTFRPKLYQNKGVQFFESSVNANSSELSKLESELQSFEADGDISLLQEQQAQLVRQIVAGEAGVKDAELATKDAQFRVSRLEAELRKEDPNYGSLGDFERDTFPNGILLQLAQLQQQREALRMTQLDSGDKVQNNRQQFQALAGMLAANLRTSLTLRQDDLSARRKSLAELKERLRGLHDKQMKWVALNRESGAKVESLNFYRRKLEEAKAADAMERLRIGNVIVVQRAIDLPQPVGLRKTVLFALGAVASLLAAIVWVCLMELFDNKIYKSEQIEFQLKVPVLATVTAGRLPRMFTVPIQESNAPKS